MPLSSRNAHPRTISSDAPSTIHIRHIINTLLPLRALQARKGSTELLGRANPRTVLRSATPALGIMHAGLARQTRRQAPGIAKPLLGLGVDDADATAVPAALVGIAGIAGVIDADLVRAGALDVAEAAAEDGVWAVAGLLDGEAGQGFAFLAVGAGLRVGGEGAGWFAAAGAEVRVGLGAGEGWGGLDADFLL